MRFFSNDARETPDDEETTDGRPERVKSEPVAVPVQRPASSPWAATPGPATPGAAGPAPSVVRDDERPGGGPVAGRPPFHEPAPQPTAFGAGTVGGAVAASALANPVNDAQHDTDRRTDTASGVADDRTVAPGDGVRPDDGRTESSSPSGAGPRPHDRVDSALRDGGTFADPVVESAGDGPSDPDGRFPSARAETTAPRPDTDRAALTGTDQTDLALTDPDRTDLHPVVVARTDLDRTDADRTDVDRTELDRTELDRTELDRTELDRTDVDRADPGASPPDATAPAEREPAAVATDSRTEQTEKLPGTVAAPELGPLFADRDAHAFRDRWRDVQLRFVDDPKAAADEAADLVDEVVEALTAALKQQREQITGGTAGQDAGDTEQLRVRLRSYRDFLDHLLSR